MGLITETIEVQLTGYSSARYEKLGYEIPRIFKNYRYIIPLGAKITVKVTDLPPNSNYKVEAKCDCCGNIKTIAYSRYLQNIDRNGCYLCTYDTMHRDFINNISYDSVILAIKKFYEKNGRFPLNNEYTEDNGFNFTYSKLNSVLKLNNTTLNDELAKIDCFSVVNYNEKYYDVYFQRLKEIINENKEVGNNLYLLSRKEYYTRYKLPSIRWFIKYCPDTSVNNVESFKNWAGFYTYHMTKERCSEIILNMTNNYDRPLMYDDFRGHVYGQVTLNMIREHWGSVNKMKEELGLEIVQESMIDKQLSKEDFDCMVQDICQYVLGDNRNFVTTREINENSCWQSYGTLYRMAKKYYSSSLQEIFEKYGVTLGKQGNGILYDFDDGEHTTSQFEYMFSKFLRNYGLQYNVDYFRDVKYSTFIDGYNDLLNCDYVIHVHNKIIYIEIAGIIEEYKSWYYQNKSIDRSKSKEKYRIKLQKKETMLKENGLIYFILFPCDLTEDNMLAILEDCSLELRKSIEKFKQNNIDWVKIRENGGKLDYSQPFLRDTRPKQKEVV